MNDNSAPIVVLMSIEIEIPNDLPDELQDVIVDDLTCDHNIDLLQRLIKKWTRFISGEACHVAIDVE